MDYDEARRTLATAMRWEGLEVREWGRGEALTGFPPLGWLVADWPAWSPDTTEEMRRQYMAWAREQKHSHYVYANEEPDPVRRRRLALVHVAWQAATADQCTGGAA